MATMSTVSASDIQAKNSRPNLLVRFWNALCESAERNTRREQMAYFQSLSDAELAERGIRRDNIASYVFRDLFYT